MWQEHNRLTAGKKNGGQKQPQNLVSQRQPVIGWLLAHIGRGRAATTAITHQPPSQPPAPLPQ